MKTTLALLTALAAAGLAHGAIQYTITDLGPVTTGSGDSFGLTINNPSKDATDQDVAAQVAGYFINSAGNTRAFRSPIDGTMIDLGAPGSGNASIANAINDDGIVVGSANIVPNGKRIAFVAVANTPVSLGTFFGGTSSSALGINKAGTIVGSSETLLNIEPRPVHAFYTTKSGTTYTLHDLGTLGGLDSVATAINDSDVIVGQSTKGSGLPLLAFKTTIGSGILTDLGTLRGGTTSAATAINAFGDIVGNSEIVLGSGFSGHVETHGFFFSGKSSGLYDLRTLPGGTYSYARGINDSGVIVGYGDDGSHATHAFITGVSSRVGLVDLNTLIDPASGWELNYAYAINNKGQITGQGIKTTTEGTNTIQKAHAFLLTPTAATEIDGTRHPADTDHADGEFVIDASELSAYLTAYLEPGSAIDGLYLSEALTIYLSPGGKYKQNPGDPLPNWSPLE